MLDVRGLLAPDVGRCACDGSLAPERGAVAVTGLTFADAWAGRIRRPFDALEVDFIGKAAFVRDKRVTGR
jgi:hypothetical protein